MLRPVKTEFQKAPHWLKRHSSTTLREGMARYAIPSGKAFGVSISNFQLLA